jgi:hypothetical protein
MPRDSSSGCAKTHMSFSVSLKGFPSVPAPIITTLALDQEASFSVTSIYVMSRCPSHLSLMFCVSRLRGLIVPPLIQCQLKRSINTPHGYPVSYFLGILITEAKKPELSKGYAPPCASAYSVALIFLILNFLFAGQAEVWLSGRKNDPQRSRLSI